MRRLTVSLIFCALFILGTFSSNAADSAAEVAFEIACDLASKSEAERKAALGEIVAMGESNEKYFISMIKSQQTIQRQISAEILGEIGSVNSEQVLIDAVSNRDVFLQGAAARALSVLYSRLPQELLVKRLRSTDKTIVSMAVMYGAYKRARYRNEQLTSEMLKAVSDLLITVQDKKEMQAAVMVLKYADTQEAVLALLGVAGRTKDVALQIEICNAVEAIAPEGQSESIEKLSVSGIPSVEVAAWSTLSAMGYKNTDKALAVLAVNPNPSVQAKAIQALAKYSGKKYDPLFVGALRSVDARVRLQALHALVETNSAHSAAEVAKMMGPDGDADPYVRAQAALVFAKLTRSGGLVPLLKDSRDERENKVQYRLEAIKALGTMGDNGALRALIDMLRDDDMLVRIEVIKSLGMIGDKRAVAKLNEMLAIRKGEELVVLKEVIAELNQ